MLEKCTNFWGGTEIDFSAPNISEMHNIYYLPRNPSIPAHGADAAWGLYHQDGRLVEQAAYRRGEDLDLVGQQLAIDTQKYSKALKLSDKFYYGGVIHWEYGHFLISSLSRLWGILQENPERKIVFHSHEPIETVFSRDYVARIMSAIGIKQYECLSYSEPVIFENISIPSSLFTEQYSANIKFSEFVNDIGDRVLRQDHKIFSSSPIYLSRSRLARGVRNIINEDVFIDALSARGVQIVYPEELNLAEQISVFNKERAVLGLLGSAFHTSMFRRGGAYFIGLSHYGAVNSNFLLIDKINRNRAEYFLGSGHIYERKPPSPKFSQSLAIHQPVNLAEMLLAEIKK